MRIFNEDNRVPSDTPQGPYIPTALEILDAETTMDITQKKESRSREADYLTQRRVGSQAFLSSEFNTVFNARYAVAKEYIDFAEVLEKEASTKQEATPENNDAKHSEDQETSHRNSSQPPPEEASRQGEPLNTIDKLYYEKSKFYPRRISDLAKLIAVRTKKPKVDNHWLLATRHYNKTEELGGSVEETRETIYYFLRDDGELVRRCETHVNTTHRVRRDDDEYVRGFKRNVVDTIKYQEEHMTERAMQEQDILLFDFKPECHHSKSEKTEVTTDRDPASEVIQPWKGLGMESMLAYLNDEPISTIKQAQAGDARSQSSLGQKYLLGSGIKQNFAEATKWFRAAAIQGDASGQFGLGMCYQHGCGLTQDLEQAKKWYAKAANQGHEWAQDKLKCVFGDDT